MEINELTENLRQQVLLLKEFSRLAKLKQEALLNHNIKQLDAVTLREEQLLGQVAVLQEARLTWGHQVAQELGTSPDQITLPELACRFPELRNVYTELTGIIDELRSVNEVNSELIRQALGLVNFSISLFTQDSPSVYNRPDKKQSQQAKIRLLDRSV